MAYISFQTDKADFVFYGANHLYGRIQPSLFDGIDALVLEGLDSQPERISPNTFNERSLFVSIFGNKPLAEKIREENIPIYQLDARAKNNLTDTLRDLVLRVPMIPYVAVSMFYGFLNCQMPNSLQKFSGSCEKIIAGSEVIGRSVVAAEKTNEYIVPAVSKEVHKDKPKIGIIYGAAHYLITDFLKSDNLRKELLDKLKKSGFEDFNKDSLNRVIKYEFHQDEGVWVPQELDAALFAV